MKTENKSGLMTFEAENDLSTYQYCVVELGTTVGQVDIPDSDSDIPIGILTNDPKAGESAAVRLLNDKGSCWMKASNVIAVGAEVCMAAVATAAGKIRTMTGIANGTYYVIGRALEAATADGDVIEVMLIPAVQRVVS